MKFSKTFFGLWLVLVFAFCVPSHAGEGNFPIIRKTDGTYYEVLELLDDGSEGVVYKVRDRHTKELLAAKLFKSSDHYNRNKVAYQLMYDQLKDSVYKKYYLMHRTCSSPQVSQTPYGVVIMPYMAGGRLNSPENLELIQQVLHDPVTREEAPKILNQFFLKMCEVMYDSPLQWRDFKFENVLVSRKYDKSKDTPLSYLKEIFASALITDPGLATYNGAPNSVTMYGTPDFMSPQAMQSKNRKTSADVYSVGANMLKMLTASLQDPYGKTIGDIYNNHESPRDLMAERITDGVLLITYIIVDPDRFKVFLQKADKELRDREALIFSADPNLPIQSEGQRIYRNMRKLTIETLEYEAAERMQKVEPKLHPETLNYNGIEYVVVARVKNENGVITYRALDPITRKEVKLHRRIRDPFTLHDVVDGWRAQCAKAPAEAMAGLVNFSQLHFDKLLNSTHADVPILMQSFEMVTDPKNISQKDLLENFDKHFQLKKTSNGLPGYHSMAPELLSDRTDKRSAADTFDLGMLLFQLLTGKDPENIIFPDEYKEAVREYHIRGNAEPYRFLFIKTIEAELAKVEKNFKHDKATYRNFLVMRERILAAFDIDLTKGHQLLRASLMGNDSTECLMFLSQFEKLN